MATTNADRVGRALTILNQGLKPFVERELEAAHGKDWRDEVTAKVSATNAVQWDTQALLGTMWEQWNDVFRNVLGQSERTLVSELRDWRNRWAHQEPLSTDDAYRALDSMERLLRAISAAEAAEIEKQKQELLRIRFEEQARKEKARAATSSVEGQPLGGLKPWREVVTPHPDVASGRYQQAEFAADLWQVYSGGGADEYRGPTEFYRRTFITEGLRLLLVGALRRLAGVGGDPVVELQTNFGGGKTHSMLALYHLFAGVSAAELPGVEAVLKEAGVPQPPAARRAVLVGTALSPASAHVLPDGTEARTLWGMMAWQLAGREGYALVAESDRLGASPGASDLIALFRLAAPCLVLVDEWVAYVRQTYGLPGLPAGSFDANMTFAQALTEAAKAVPGTLVVASIPASDIEVGGEGGRQALARLKNVFSRVESAWRPASAEEGFEIVRRRLFQPVADAQLFRARDAVVRAFGEMYRANPTDFPVECREADYERRMQAAYPIHPELFDRLYQDWSSLDKFQRTRGVLRLMAQVIHELWERDDRGLLILPATLPMSASPVQSEMMLYLEDPWRPVIERDVDGPNALPNQLDRENPNLGRYSACRRVARTLLFGSAPTLHTATKGLDDRRLKLGCVQPGESVATFGDALRRLTGRANHLYEDGTRYWYSTQPSVTRMAQERAQQIAEDDVLEEIKRRLREEVKYPQQRADFAAVHVAPPSGDVPDERQARLVLLGPEHPHSRGAADSRARREAALLLSQRGTAPRLLQNTLAFLAPDQARLDELRQAVREFMAWRSIEAERETLNLDAFQHNQARAKRDQSEETLRQRIPETYYWLLVPEQPDPKGPMGWQELRVQGTDGLAVRACKRLRNEGMLVTQLAGTMLLRELNRIPLWPAGAGHVAIKSLMDYFAQYLYLHRLKDSQALVAAIQDGLALVTWQHDTFAYADGWDEATCRYQGLRAGQLVPVSADGHGLLVKPDIAARQMEADRPAPPAVGDDRPDSSGHDTVRDGRAGTGTVDREPVPEAPKPARRFHGSAPLDALRLNRDVGAIHQEVIQQLTALVGARARITLEIEVDVPDGVPDTVVRNVTENCRTLKFTDHGFEAE